MAEVDGNRTRRTRVARPNRFEGGGVHQVPGHLRGTTYLDSLRSPPMKKLLLLIIVVALAAVAVKKVQAS